MEKIAIFVGGVLTSWFADLLFPKFRESVECIFTRLYFLINKNAINLTGYWESLYKEPTSNGSVIETKESIHIKQIGSKIKGTGKIGDPYPREFCFIGEIYQDLMLGWYERDGSEQGSTTGRGVFMLEISRDRRTMKGYCTWMDKDTNRTESSLYTWNKKS
jgi:hypothetical protein